MERAGDELVVLIETSSNVVNYFSDDCQLLGVNYRQSNCPAKSLVSR